MDEQAEVFCCHGILVASTTGGVVSGRGPAQWRSARDYQSRARTLDEIADFVHHGAIGEFCARFGEMIADG
jgi:hypothetical protein